MSDKLPRVIVENDCGTLYASFLHGEYTEDYFCEVYIPEYNTSYVQGYKDGYEDVMRKVREIVDG